MLLDTNILIEFGFIGLHFLLFTANYRLMKKQLMQPAVLYSFLWFGIISLHLLFKFTVLDKLYDISPYTFVVIFISVLSFSFGSLIINILKEKREDYPERPPYVTPVWLDKVNPILRFLLLVIVIIGLPFYLYSAYQVFLASNIDKFFVGLRTELTYGDVKLGPVAYLSSFSYLVSGIFLYSFYKSRKRSNLIYFIIALLAALIYAAFTTGRGALFWVLSILVGISYLHSKMFSFRKMFGWLCFFIIIFSLIGIIYGKGGNSDASFQENVASSSEFTGSYLVAPLNALDYQLLHTQPDYSGDYSLRFFKVVGKSTGLLPYAMVKNIVQEFVFVPYSTNVYTVLSPYISDFGIYYAFFMLALFGMFQSILYNKAVQTKNLRYSLYYSMTLLPLLMSFFQDMYLTIFSTWIQVFFYTELIIFINKFFRKHD